ncbi:MAG: coproporphyrinogen dehydrogenase HemZ [Lachnospiraceae bacterium]|nr:coproporphyrinogen dehydrogenase HemZ [Lachnospiraceae bacterium]
MIVVELNQDNFEYDIYSLIKAFYPREEIKVFTDDREILEDMLFRLVITYTDLEIVMEYIRGQEKISYRQDNDYSNRKETKNNLKLMLYSLLKEQTGRTLPWGTLTGIRPTKIPLKLLEQGKGETEIYQYMRDTYDISREKAELALQVAKAEYGLLKKFDYEAGYSLYIGIPFCPSTCLYCSFTSYPIGIWKDRADEYLEGVFKEIDFVAENLSHRPLHTIYIGGGTPTSLTAEQIDRLLTKIENTLDLSHLMEFTVEAGRPDSITEEKLQVIHNHGIERISINPQTMNQKTLDLIGRHHTVEQIRESFAMARRVGISCINTDLIVGLPGESLEDVAYTLEEIQKLDPDNLTVHSLALKRSARLNLEWDKYQDYVMENSEAHIELAADTAKAMGMSPYYLYRQKNMTGNLENIGYAKAGKEGLYNILIMEERQSIIALGAGAASKYVMDHGERVERTENVKDVGVYLERLDEMIERKRKAIGEFLANDMVKKQL